MTYVQRKLLKVNDKSAGKK